MKLNIDLKKTIYKLFVEAQLKDKLTAFVRAEVSAKGAQTLADVEAKANAEVETITEGLVSRLPVYLRDIATPFEPAIVAYAEGQADGLIEHLYHETVKKFVPAPSVAQ